MGRTVQEADDRMDPARAAALHAALGLGGVVPAAGDPLPAFWHHIYFWDAQPPEALGPDGHRSTGHGLIPDLGLPRRMWAGGRLTWHAPLLCGVRAEKTSQVANITRKSGRSGELGFVTLRHTVRQRGGVVLTEDQDLVYRGPAPHAAKAPDPPGRPVEAQIARFDETLLFRYSALTMNGHRIHYDADYARGTEGYPGLVVHGPLLATLLMGLAARREGPLNRFEFRATAPLCLPETARLCADGVGTYWIVGEDGRTCMVGSTTA
ncbi:MAG: MaoC family dehydratase N-terminal domain-containing protein [Pseudomonadota bacterium]